MEPEGNGGSEQPSSSEAKPLALMMTEEDFEGRVSDIVHRTIEAVLISPAERALDEELLTGGSRNDMLDGRSLQLEFLGKVPDPVRTGVELKGVEHDPLTVALRDAAKHTVTCEPESSGIVEIVLLDDANDLTHENFENKIIKVADKGKPHFARPVYISLKKGVGDLSGIKLSHRNHWTKVCYCRLGARIVQNIRGVREAWTVSFKVIDKRTQQYGKHDKPSLSSELWRLKGISIKGNPFKRMKEENIITIQDFRFWLSVDPAGLQDLFGAAKSQWEAIVSCAKNCTIDDKKMYSYKSSTDPQLTLTYNSVGKLNGVIEECGFLPIDNLSDQNKARARESLKEVLKASAFGERYKTEVSLDINVSSIQQCLNGSDLTISGTIGQYQTTEPGSSSQFVGPSNFSISGPSNTLGSKDMEETCHTASDLQQNAGLTLGPSMQCEKGKAVAQEPLASASNSGDEVPLIGANDFWDSIGSPPSRTDPLESLPPGGGVEKDLATESLGGASSSKYSNTSFPFEEFPEEDFVPDESLGNRFDCLGNEFSEFDFGAMFNWPDLQPSISDLMRPRYREVVCE